MLPRPVGVVFRALLVTTGDPRLVRWMVLLKTDQIWTTALAMFLNYCHSMRGTSDGRQPPLPLRIVHRSSVRMEKEKGTS